jgi:hypothetical protein
MSEVSHFNPQFMILFVMGCISLIISVLLHFKYRELRKLSENPRVSIFDKTFNVLNLSPVHREIIQSWLMIAVVLSFLSYFIIGYIVSNVLGILLRLGLLLPCLGLMMIESFYDIYDNTKDFTKALRSGVGLAEGDYTALTFLKETLPRLRAYYALLTAFFFASFAIAPYIFEPALLVFVQAVSLMWTVPISAIGVLGVFVGCFATAAVAVFILKLGAKIKSAIFSFPENARLPVLKEPFNLRHGRIAEDYEVEEGKKE